MIRPLLITIVSSLFWLNCGSSKCKSAAQKICQKTCDCGTCAIGSDKDQCTNILADACQQAGESPTISQCLTDLDSAQCNGQVLDVPDSCQNNNSPDATPSADGIPPDANMFTGECNPMAPHAMNGCPPDTPKCSFSVLAVAPNLTVETRCQKDGTIVGNFQNGCERFVGDPANGLGYDTCAMDSGDTNNPLDDKTYGCITRGDAGAPTQNDRYCQQICDIDTPACPSGFSCQGISGIFDDIEENLGFCSPTCDPRNNPNPLASAQYGDRCTIVGEYCTPFVTGEKTCSTLGSVDTWDPCQYTNDCSTVGQGCLDYNQNFPNDYTCGLYCNASAASPDTEAWNEAQQTSTSCNLAMALSSHPHAVSNSFVCAPLAELYSFPTPPPALQDYDGVCHWCDPKGADAGAEPCCEMDMMGNKVPAAMPGDHCFGCFEKWGCPINTTAKGGNTKGLKATPPEGAEKGFMQRAK